MIQGLVIGCLFCLVVGLGFGFYFGLWYAEVQSKKERKSRQEIADMVKSARDNQQRRAEK